VQGETDGETTMAVDWSQCKPVKTYEQVDLDLFRRTIQPAQKPAILRGLVSDWPIVQAGLISDQEVCTYVAFSHRQRSRGDLVMGLTFSNSILTYAQPQSKPS
jgi:hypothetical protein